MYCPSYSISIQFGSNCASLNECFTDPIFEISEFESEKSCEGGGAAEEIEGVQGKVSYSVSGDLQVT